MLRTRRARQLDPVRRGSPLRHYPLQVHFASHGGRKHALPTPSALRISTLTRAATANSIKLDAAGRHGRRGVRFLISRSHESHAGARAGENQRHNPPDLAVSNFARCVTVPAKGSLPYKRSLPAVTTSSNCAIRRFNQPKPRKSSSVCPLWPSPPIWQRRPSGNRPP
jgi:hypothetical protein